MVLLQVRVLPAPRKEFIDILDKAKGGVDSWLSSGLENRRPCIRVAGSNPVASAILAHSVTVSTKHFDCFSSSSNLGEPTVDFLKN